MVYQPSQILVQSRFFNGWCPATSLFRNDQVNSVSSEWDIAAPKGRRASQADLAHYKFIDPHDGLEHRLAGKQQQSHCLRKTALGLRWEPWCAGGNEPILCDEDMVRFQRIVQMQGQDLNCISTPQAQAIVRHLRMVRLESAVELLEKFGCPQLAVSIRKDYSVEPPTHQWLKEFASTMDIRVCAPAQLEEMRRKACNSHAIEERIHNQGGRIVRTID
jgi:hypothetical protein